MTDNDEMIDNSQHFYIHLRLPCGVEIRARPGVLSNCPSVRQSVCVYAHWDTREIR